jgi:hypothetical protein
LPPNNGYDAYAAAKKDCSKFFNQVAGKAMVIAIALIGFGMMTRYWVGRLWLLCPFTPIWRYLGSGRPGITDDYHQVISDPQEDETKFISNVLAIRLITSLLFLKFCRTTGLLMPYPGVLKLEWLLPFAGFTAAALTSVLTSYFQKKFNHGPAVAAESR